MRLSAADTPRLSYYWNGAEWESGGLLLDCGSRTNRALWNRDLANGAWTKTNGAAAKDQVGLDAVANSASSFTATSCDATCMQTITDANAQRTFSIYLKRINGRGKVDITLDGGTTWIDVTRWLTSTRYTRVYHTMTVLNPTIGIRLRTSGDSVAVDVAQEETGGCSSSPILTTSRPVSRTADLVTVCGTAFSSWYTADQGTFVFEWLNETWNRVPSQLISIDDGSGSNYMRLVLGDFAGTVDAIQINTGALQQARFNVGYPSAGVIRRAAFRYQPAAFAASGDGLVLPAILKGVVPVVKQMQIGSVNGAGGFFGFLRRIHHYSAVLSDDALAALSAAAPLPCPMSSEGMELGINISGLEFGGSAKPGTANVNYFIPRDGDLAYFQSHGMNVIRLPFLWERVQLVRGGALDATYLGYLTTFVGRAAALGMKVILDLHNYGKYNGTAIGAVVTEAHFADVWSRLSLVFAGMPGVYGYDLMNEPGGLANSAAWYSAAQAAINAIRANDTISTIFCEGYGNASGAQAWIKNNPDIDVYVTDPNDKLILSAHSYWDDQNSGIYDESFDGEQAFLDVGVIRLRPFLAWCRSKGLRGHIGEFGVPKNDPRWITVLDRALEELARQGIAFAAWGGGDRWADSYSLKLSPGGGYGNPDQPQMAAFAKYASANTGNIS
jgi:aryl-phospho-beta-D-glucosidase BglC (GH1 family)